MNDDALPDHTDENEDDSAARRGGSAPIVAAVAVLLVVAGLVAVLATREPATDRIGTSPLLGRPAPALTGPMLGGGDFDLREERGRWVVVNFFATWCAPCRREHPDLIEWEARSRAAGTGTLVTVVFSDTAQNTRDFFEARGGGTWPVLAGDDGSIGLDWGVAGVPESFIVDPSGVVRAKILGGVTLDGLDRIIADLQAGAL